MTPPQRYEILEELGRGEIRPGSRPSLPPREELVRGDPQARRLAGQIEQDLRGLGRDPASLLEAAIADYAEALKLNPAADKIWMHRGIARLSLGIHQSQQGRNADALYDAALDDFSRALRLNPTNAQAWQYQGHPHHGCAVYGKAGGESAAGHCRAALDAYEQAGRLNPALADALRQPMASCRRRLESLQRE
ncbi:MAG: hypothetical protein HYY16_17225 [Planctomycetes bacterium]|nr:hypothetical protein [Planctomycetota bacterium]